MNPESRLTHERAAKKELWARCLRALDRDMRPCVLHNYESLDALLASDVDCVVPARHLPSAVARRLAAAGIRVVQHVRYESTAHSFILGDRTGSGDWGFLRLDIAADFRYSTKPLVSGRVFFTEAELARSQRSFAAFNIPAPDVEFGYYLIKRIGKGHLNDDHGRALSILYRQDPAGCRRQLARFWGERRAAQLAGAAAAGEWTEVRSRLPECRAELLRRSAASAPGRLLGYWLHDIGRLARRWLQPAGLYVVLVGADGADAPALTDAIATSLGPAFNGAELVRRGPHRRLPGVVAKTGGAHIADALWYWRRVHPALVRVRLVLVEGGRPDRSDDQARRRPFPVRRWLRRPLKLVPPPDLVIRLDALPAAGTVTAVSDAIVEHLAGRTSRRLDLAPPPPSMQDALPIDPSPQALSRARAR